MRTRSKWLTDNTDATDLFFTDFVFMWIDMRLYGALIYTDFLLLESIRAVQAQILSEYNPRPSDNTRLKKIRSIRSIRVRLTSEFFRTRIYRIDADYLLLEYIEENPRPSKSKNKKIREKIKSVASALSVNLLSACGLSRRRGSTIMWNCLPD